MKGLLVRVAADQSEGGGEWNGPIKKETGEFVYVPIPEDCCTKPGLEKPFTLVQPFLTAFGRPLPRWLEEQCMHLDPDFFHLTYGDGGSRAKQIRGKLAAGDILVFYSALCNPENPRPLVYAIIGLYVIESTKCASEVCKERADENAHTRRMNPRDGDIVVYARHNVSGRLERCMLIGEYRINAGENRKGTYRVTKELLRAWGDIDVKDGYLKRSGRLQQFCDAERFYRWFKDQKPSLVDRNN
ncbi:MAG: hypothetical protein ABSE73_03115 [Planctomycetota bacterium]